MNEFTTRPVLPSPILLKDPLTTSLPFCSHPPLIKTLDPLSPPRKTTTTLNSSLLTNACNVPHPEEPDPPNLTSTTSPPTPPTMPRGPRKNRGKKPPGGDHGPRHAAAPLDEDHDMLTPPAPRYLPPQLSRPRGGGGGGGGGRHPPSATTTNPPPPSTTALTTRRGRHPPPTHLIHPLTALPSNPTPRPPPQQTNPYPPRCPTCHTTSCQHHHAAHVASSVTPCCAHCEFVRRCNYDLRDAVAASLASCGAALARWADDVGVGSGGSVDMMEWQPEGTTLIVLGGEWGAAAAGEGRGGEAVVEGGRGRDRQAGGGGVSPQSSNKALSPPTPMTAAVMSPRSIARIAMENKTRQQLQPYQAVNTPPTPPVQAAMTAALVDMGANLLQVPPAQPQPQEVHPLANGGGIGWPQHSLGFDAGGGPPVQDGRRDVPGSSFSGYRDS